MSKASHTNLEFGSEALDYSTQSRSDFSWPSATHRVDAAAAARAQRGTAIVVGYDASPATSESRAAYIAHSITPHRSTPVSHSHTSIVMGTDSDASESYVTSYRAGFPPRAVTANITSMCKAATLAVNRAHFSLGGDATVWETAHSAGERSAAAAREAGPSELQLVMEAKAAARRVKSDAREAGTAASHLAAAGGEAPLGRVDTSNYMPVHDVAGARTAAVNPNRSAGVHGARAAQVMAGLTTHGKPLSAVAFGYEAPEYVSTAMHSEGVSVKALKAPYVPQLVPKYVKEHPALLPAKA